MHYYSRIPAVLTLLAVVAEGSAVLPFVYTLF